MTIFENGSWHDNIPWKSKWEALVWYSKKYDQYILSDRFYRIWTCNQAPHLQYMSQYVGNSLVYVGEL